jgi:hypothetical protein
VKAFLNTKNGYVVHLSENTPVPSHYEPYDGAPCGSCGVKAERNNETIKTVVPENVENSFEETEETEEVVKHKKGKTK